MAAPFDGLMSIPFAPSETFSSSQVPYDVFINHHGGDVKHGLATTTYNKLDATGLRVFLDKYELKIGIFFPRALQDAMRSSPVHIAIFSKNYARSPWCLAELDYILQLPDINFIPIFYDVEPSDLRWAIEGKGIYADAFNNYEMKGRYSSGKHRSWKSALHKASFYTGEIINNQSNKVEAVMNVVNRVLKELKKNRLDVAKHPVGLDEAEQDFHDNIALQSAAGPAQIVGIYGMGGAGKTTLAKYLYNNKCSSAKKSSFLFDVREAARKELLHEKQRKLLQDLGVDLKSEGVVFDHVDEGKEILKSRLRSVHVLIVLDDVDHTDQLDALLPARENLGHGSLIIVTTRELSVLKAGGISTIYKMRTLNPSHAHQLFCLHAFRQWSPFSGFESLAKEFVDACHGLPLSLKVLGGLLCGHSCKNYWQSQLDKLSRIVPKDIKSTLKISYDALDKEDKEMFLDVACFFIGCTSSRAIAIWDASGWTGLHGWQMLVNKCLVELDEDNKIRMHNHLRDLGREIANQQSPYRLWSEQQIIEIQSQQEAVRIRGIVNAIGDNCYTRKRDIIINTNQGERSLSPASLGLKIFVGDGDFINEERRELSGELLCFQCERFRQQNLPSWLSMKKLRILEVHFSERLEDLWGCDADVPLQLRELVIGFYDFGGFHGFPRSIGHLKNLKKISIDSAWRFHNLLSHLPEEFCNLHALEHLEMKRCKNLSYLPSNFGNLTNLKHLDLYGSSRLKTLPDSCKKLTLLEYLNLSECHELTIKPGFHIFENMTKIKYLCLKGCSELEDLRLPKAVSLTKLYLGGTRLKALPSNIFQLTKLTELEIGGEFLTVLPTCAGNSSSLTKIEIVGCMELESLPDSLEHLNCLKDLYISNSGVKCLPKSLIHLQSLQIIETPISELSWGPGCMLKTIRLQGTKVSKISICGDCCPFLESLTLCSNEELRELEILPATLKSLYVIDCKVLEDIRGVRGLRNLQYLSTSGCGQVDELPNFAELESLEFFQLRAYRKVKKIAGLQELRSLQTLSIKQLDELPNLAELTPLRKIRLAYCDKLEMIERLDHLRSLKELDLFYCPQLKSLPSLAKLTSIKHISLVKCFKLRIACLKGLTSLEYLQIDECAELDGLPGLAELTSLKGIYLQKYGKLKKVEGLESLGSLKELSIDDCAELDLAKLTLLEIIDLKNCSKLKKVEGLESLGSLKELRIDDCAELVGLPDLAKLTLLEIIVLKNCSKLKKVEGLESLGSLKILSIYNCPVLDGLPSLGELSSLEIFELKLCHNLKKIEGFESSRSWKNLRIHYYTGLTVLEEIELKSCNNLEKIECFKSLKSLKTLCIEDCSALETLPSLAELTSLRQIKLKNCNKLKKIEGLDRLTSLEKLEVHSISKGQSILGLECNERLKSLAVISNQRLVVEPFINDIQRWPREMIVCTRAAIDVDPPRNVVEFESCGSYARRNLTTQESSANANAILICFSIDSVCPEIPLALYTDGSRRMFRAELANGKWVLMGVFPEGSDWLLPNWYFIQTYSSEDRDAKVKEAWLLMGDQGSIVEAFHQLSER